MNKVGQSEVRVDGYDKATGRTKYYEDRMPADALYVRIKHAEKAHAIVKSIDTAAALAIPGVVKVLTCFDVPDITFPTAGHPWSMDPAKCVPLLHVTSAAHTGTDRYMSAMRSAHVKTCADMAWRQG